MSEQNVASSSQQFELPSLEDLEQRATQVIKQTLKQNNYVIPQSYRFKLWMKLLNAKPISDPFNAKSKKSKLDEKNLSQLQADSATSVKQIESLGRKTNQQTLAATPDILQAYCENNSLEYKQQLGQILAPVAFVASVEQEAATKEDEYFLLSKFIREYAPFLYSNTAEHLTCFCQLFRLLLQYHDPLLSLHLDKNRLMPEDYVSPYITSVFANQVENPLLCDLYDYFLIEGSPILVHFFAIAMYMHIRDSLLAAKDEAVADLVKNRKITSKEEISAVFKLAQELYQQTPSSARNQVDVLTYPTKETQIDEYLEWFKNNVVLPIPVSELVAAFRKVKSKTENPQKYFIIDCRSLKSFTYARLPTSVHVGNVGYDPKKLQAILDRFAGAKGTNFVVFGTGKGLQDEENLLRVIALKFVQYGFPHISIALGGFKECIKYIVNGEIEFVRDEKKKPVKAATDNNFLSTEFLTSKVKDLWSWGKKVAEQYTTKEEKAAEAAKASASATSTTVEGKAPEAPKNKISSEQTTLEDDSAFTLGDEEVELDFSEDEEEGPEDEKLVRISDLQALGNVNIFASQLKTGKKQSEQRYIVVGDTFLMSMKSHPTMLHYGVIMWKRNLRQLLRLCYHKENNKIMTFVIKGTPQEIMAVTDETANSFQETYFMEDSLKCVETIKENTLKLKKRTQ